MKIDVCEVRVIVHSDEGEYAGKEYSDFERDAAARVLCMLQEHGAHQRLDVKCYPETCALGILRTRVVVGPAVPKPGEI